MNATHADGGDGKSVLHDKDLLYLATSADRLIRPGHSFLAIGENYETLLTLQDRDCCGIAAPAESEQEDHNQEGCVAMSR